MADEDPRRSSVRRTVSDAAQYLGSFGALALLLLAVLAFKDFIMDANNIPTGSMIPTLKVGDYLFVNRMRYSLRAPFLGREIVRIDNPRRGDIITFLPIYERDKNYVKRVIALPGDRVRIRNVPACELSAFLSRSSVGPAGWKPEMASVPADQRDYACAPGEPGRYPQPRVAVVEYREDDQGPWRNFGPRQLDAATSRAITEDSDDVNVLHPEARNLQPPLDPIVDSGAGPRALFLENVGGVVHVFAEADGPGAAGGLCQEINTERGCLVPEDSYLGMGDNRDDSTDSRQFGWITRDRIFGKAVIIYFSVNWYDQICAAFREPGYQLPNFPPEEQARRCGEGASVSGRAYNEFLLGYVGRWIWETLRFRAPRMDVRWSRIGTILHGDFEPADWLPE